MFCKLWLEHDFFISDTGMGKDAYIFGFNFLLTLRKQGRLQSFLNYVRSILNPGFFGVTSAINKQCIPSIFNIKELHELVFGFDKNGKHWIDFMSQIFGAMINYWYYKLTKFFNEVYGTAHHEYGAGFDSDSMRGETLEDTIEFTMDTFTGYYISESHKIELDHEWKKISSAVLDIPKPAGITKMGQEYLDDSYVVLF